MYVPDSRRVRERVQVSFGSRVRQLRLAAELTQEDLAHRCGLFRTYMSRIETGNANPTLTIDPTFLSYPVAKAVNPRFGLGWEASIRSTM